MSRLQVRLLGQFEVRLDGQPVDLPSRPAQSLLAYLILTAGTAHRREKLAGLLWPDSDEPSARNSLRQALWRIRQAIETGGQAFLLADNIAIAFDADADYWLDATALERDNSINALAAYRGELLPGFYDEWAVLERERLRAIFERKMQKQLEEWVEEERWADVLEGGERWIALGGAPEPAYRALMAAYAGLADTARMAAVYQRCVEALRNELGVEPSEQTMGLYVALASGARPSASLAGGAQPAIFTEDLPPAPGEPPFKGLHFFDEADADLFFGRELLTARLVGHLREHRFLAVIVGASGSGKSSVVRAGLVPALKRGEPLADGTLPPEGSVHWHVHVIAPTVHPLEALAPLSLEQSEAGEANRLLLVIDQFEELFTLCHDEAERRAFVNSLMSAVSSDDGSTTLVITLRADFYAHCAQYANLREALAKHQEYIGPMNAEELRRAIEEPAKRGGWQFEPGLVELILRDVGDEPGALPLLSHALLETWSRRRGRTLTLKGYAECGGVRGAIARTAESVYQKLTPEGQAVARNIFLRLTELGEGESAVDTRRRVALSELVTNPQLQSLSQTVLQILTDARLVTTSADSAEVAHEALIREWPRLREWLAENREGLRLHRHLTEAAQAWEALSRDSGELYRGARLAQALEWATVGANREALNALEREFLEASQALAAREEAEREAQRQRELEAAQAVAEAQRQRAEEQARAAAQLRRRAFYLAGALSVAVLLVVIAGLLNVQAQVANNNRATAEALAVRQAELAAARELTMASLANLDKDPELSILLALHAAAKTETAGEEVLPETEDVLHRAIQAARLLQTFSNPAGPVGSVIFSADGMQYVTSDDRGTVSMWDAATDQELLTLTGHTGRVINFDVSPDGKRLVTASNDLTAKVWDLTNGQLLTTLTGHRRGNVGMMFFGVIWAKFSPDGTRIATAGTDGTAKLWEAATGKELLTFSGHEAGLSEVAFSPDGSHLATSAFDSAAKVWDAATGEEVLTLTGHTDVRVWAIAYSPDGTRIATASRDRTVKVWDASTGQELLTLSGHTATVNGVAFSPDGKLIATGSLDTTAKVWDAATGQELFTLAGHTDVVHGVQFSPDGARLATVSLDQTAKLWSINGGDELLTFFSDASADFALSPDGKRIATASEEGVLALWDAATGQPLLTVKDAGAGEPLYDVVFSPDGSRIATAGADKTAKAWDISAQSTLSEAEGLNAGAVTGQPLLSLDGHTNTVFSVAFSPDGSRLATASNDGTAKIWDAVTGSEILTLPKGGRADTFGRIVFSPDGSRLVTPSDDFIVRVWDTTTGKQLFTLTGHTDALIDVAFSPDGQLIATASGDQTAILWHAETGVLKRAFFGHTNYVTGVAFSPDGTRLATAAEDRTIRVWDAATGQVQLVLHSPAEVENLVFTPDGRRLITANLDETIRVYVLPVEDLVVLARSRVTRPLTSAECQQYLHVGTCPALP